MFDSSLQCIFPSDKVVSEKMIAVLGRLPPGILLVLRHHASDNRSETDLSRDSQPRIVLASNPWRISLISGLAVPLLPTILGGPICYPGYADQNRAGNGPERFASGGCNAGTEGVGALNPLEKGYNPLGPRRSRRKRGNDPPQSPRAPSKNQSRPPGTFACHFYLHDRIGHSACLNVRLARLSDVRQHLLERTHNQVVHCAVCGTIFPGRATEARRRRDAHAQAATCQPSPSPLNYPGITEDEERRIRDIARNTRTADYDGVRRWFMIWDCLFPGEQRPESPFLTDMPEIQRVSDWAGVIFSDTDRWLALANEPWTPAMSREEQNARMSNFIQSFISEARDMMEEDSGPVEDSHGADYPSINVGTPDPSGAMANRGVSSMVSSDSNRPAGAQRRLQLNPVPTTGSGQFSNPHPLGPMEPIIGEQPAVIPPLPFGHAIEPTANVPQNTQQQAASGMDISFDDPNAPSRVLQGSSTDLYNDSAFFLFPQDNVLDNNGNVWDNFGNDDAEPDVNYNPPDGDNFEDFH